MTSRYLFCAALLGASLLLGACEDMQNADDAARQSEASTPAAPADGAAPSVVAAPGAQQFVTQIGEGNFYEVEAARIALQRTRSNEMRAFANMMLKDHGRSAEQLKAAAADGAPGLVVPAGPNERQRAGLAALREAPNFDSLYLQQQRRAHEESLGDLRRFAAKGEGAALRAFAANAAGVVEGHRTRLRQIEVAAGNDGRTDIPRTGLPRTDPAK